MAISELRSESEKKFIDRLLMHQDGLEEFSRTNVKKRLEYLANGGDICELEGYESFSDEVPDEKIKRYMLLATDVDMKFIECPDPCRSLLFLASPVCTALIMEEYDLAERLLEHYPLRQRETIKIYDETQLIVIMDSGTPYRERMHEIMLESFLVDVEEKIGEKIRPFWDSIEYQESEFFWNKGVIQLPTLFGAYRHNKVYMEYQKAGIPRDAFDEDLIIDTKYDGSKLLGYLKRLSEYSRTLFKHYIMECSFEFGQLTPEAEFKLKLAIQRFAVNYFAGDEDCLMGLLRENCLEFKLPRYQLDIRNKYKEILFKHIKYCGKYYKTEQRLKYAFLDHLIQYIVERACNWPELEKYAGEFFDEEFPIMDYAVLRGHCVNCFVYTQVFTKIAKGSHFYHINLERTVDAKYMLSMFSMLDEKPPNTDSSWIVSSDYGNYRKRLCDMMFWLEDMENVEIDVPDGSMDYGMRDLDFIDIQSVVDYVESGVPNLDFMDIDDRYFYLLAFIWKKVCQTGDAELFTLAYKKGFIPKSQIGFALEKFGNGEGVCNKSLVPVMLGVV
jgi:hypothetical protein